MAENEETMEVEDSNGDSNGDKVKLRFTVRDPSEVGFFNSICMNFILYICKQ